MRFDLNTPHRVVFAPGSVADLPAIARESGDRALLVTSGSSDRFNPAINALRAAGVDTTVFRVEGEPTVQVARAGSHAAVECAAKLVIGIGGGSPIDAAKAIAILATNSGEPLDYLEVVGKGNKFSSAPLPFLAVPTTAGTGAEATRNAVLGSTEHGLKASLRHPSMMAKVALIDPDLTLDLPPELTASTGLDALTQLVEPYVSCRSNPFVDLLCVEGMKRVRESLVRACENGRDRTAREDMSFASFQSGIALANAGLGVVHGFAAPLGGMLSARHGALCAAVLPAGVAMNVQALRARAPSHPALPKYAAAARILTGKLHAEAEDLAPWLAELVSRLDIQPLRQQGLRHEQIESVVDKAGQASSMKANPIPLTREELIEVAQRAF